MEHAAYGQRIIPVLALSVCARHDIEGLDVSAVAGAHEQIGVLAGHDHGHGSLKDVLVANNVAVVRGNVLIDNPRLRILQGGKIDGPLMI